MVYQERLNEAHARAKGYAEQIAAERVELDKHKVYCPPIDVGQQCIFATGLKAEMKSKMLGVQLCIG